MDPTKYHKRIKDVTLILRDLLKVIKVVSMYPEDNPLPQSLRRTFSERLEELVCEYGEISVAVHRDHLELEGDTVFADKSKEESLAGLFFEIGITNFRFKEGLDVEEIYKLLDVIKLYMNSPAEDLDLVGMIWESGITRFGVTTVEDIALAEYDGEVQIQELIGLSGSGLDGQVQMSQEELDQYQALFASGALEQASLDDDSDVQRDTGKILAAPGRPLPPGYRYAAVDPDDTEPPQANVFDDEGDDSLSLRTAEAAQAMGLGDLKPAETPVARPDTTLILNDELRLSEEEEAHVKTIVREDAEFDPYETTAELLKEMLHQETEFQGFSETVMVCEKVINEFVQAGKLSHAGWVLDYFQVLETQIRGNRPQWADRLGEALITTGSRDRLKSLSEMLNRNEELGQFELRRYLSFFGWESLSGLTDLLGDLQHQNHREALCDFLAERGQQHSHLVAKGLSDKRWYVVRNSVIIMCRIGDHQALTNLKRVVSHSDARVRSCLVDSLKDCRNVEALDLLTEAVRDTDPSIRKEAVNSIVAWRGEAAFDAITGIISNPSFAELEPEDKEAVLVAYSKLGGDLAVEYLYGLIKKPNVFRDTNLSILRAAAFEALTHNQSERCERALLKLTSSWRSDVKQQAIDAIRRRRELMYGGSDA